MLCFSEDPVEDFSPRFLFFVFKIPTLPLSYPRGWSFFAKNIHPPAGRTKRILRRTKFFNFVLLYNHIITVL